MAGENNENEKKQIAEPVKKTGGSPIEKLSNYVKENKFVAIAVAVLLVLIIAMIIVYAGMSKKPANNGLDTTDVIITGTQTGTEATGSTVDVLPETQRTDEITSTVNTDVDKDPFSEPAVLKGTVLNEVGGNLAIIKYGGATYIVSKGEKIANVWTVKSILPGQVTLVRNGHETVIRIAKDSDGGAAPAAG